MKQHPIALLALLSTSIAQVPQDYEQCIDDVVLKSSTCNPNDVELCRERCGVLNTQFLLDKCCAHDGVTASILAYEPNELWVDRLNDYNLCTGAKVRVDYVDGGEDAMPRALAVDIGNGFEDGQGIYDAYIAHTPWLPSIYDGLKNLSAYIEKNAKFVDIMDIDQAARDASAYGGEMVAFPYDTNYFAMGWRQDVFKLHSASYRETYNEELAVPKTIEELVLVSERLNGLDHNGDGEPDWGFCVSPQTKVFYAFLAPVMQTHLRECKTNTDGEFHCGVGERTGQNLFFDVDTFEPLIHDEGFKYAFDLYNRFVRASNCKPGGICDFKAAFSDGRCAGAIALPETLTEMLLEDGEYTIQPRLDEEGNVVWAPGQNLSDGEYWGRRSIFPGSDKVLDWTTPGRPLVDCVGMKCPLANDGINYSPFFGEGADVYAINGRQTKPQAADAIWDLIMWFSEVEPIYKPLNGMYRTSQLAAEKPKVAIDWNDIMAEDLRQVLMHEFKSDDMGGNPSQDLMLRAVDEYIYALDIEMHQKLIFADVSDGGLYNENDPSKSLDAVKDKRVYDANYQRFISDLEARFDDINGRQDGGALRQLILWRESLDLQPKKDEQDVCSDLLATNQAIFEKMNCISKVNLQSLCDTQKDDIEEYSPGLCVSVNSSDQTTTIVIVLCSVLGGGFLVLVLLFVFHQFRKMRAIAQGHEQLMEATLNESIRSLRQLDYPLHLVRGDDFVAEGKLLRHEVLRNTHRLTVLDSLSDVDSFIDVGKHIVFLSHQWTSFSCPDAYGAQYKAMCISLKELARESGWDESLKDVFVWADFCCLPQANASIQSLAVRSLAAYAASATYFIIVAPDTKHADLDEVCDIDTYQKRMWTRAEQVCHSMRNGTEGMFITKGEELPLAKVEHDFFKESLRVFEGELTCCRLEHKGMSVCDRQCLVIPLLGLFGELYRASVEGGKGGNIAALSSVEAFLTEIEMHQDSVFPPTFSRTTWRKNKQFVEEIVLFGDLIDRMKARVKGGGGFAIDDDNTNTMTTIGSDYVRHGADLVRNDLVRHGATMIRHGAGQGIRY
mmetsp:Transcript_6071/g.12796  ORF Transcript_6071/g.12796 Transcript_6071/m.12796 type:complete len:1062 (-) Transcript_6071:175-3360(-)